MFIDEILSLYASEVAKVFLKEKNAFKPTLQNSLPKEDREMLFNVLNCIIDILSTLSYDDFMYLMLKKHVEPSFLFMGTDGCKVYKKEPVLWNGDGIATLNLAWCGIEPDCEKMEKWIPPIKLTKEDLEFDD